MFHFIKTESGKLKTVNLKSSRLLSGKYDAVYQQTMASIYDY
uniref:Uncharacterized protein n=1 Tax=uncultured Desulfobacterium sp. TaxID=201089 RepID=E1Y917_9BACT|nr:unknown protein [uncultured Desulfobacterium sp.]